MATPLVAQAGPNRITADEVNNYSPPIQTNKAGRAAELEEARANRLEAGVVIQDFTSKRFQGKKFRLIQRKKGDKYQLIMQTLEPNRKVKAMVVDSFDKPITEGQFAYGSALSKEVAKAFGAMNSDANKSADSSKNNGNLWDATVGFAVDAVMGLPETIAGIPEGLARNSAALVGDLAALGEVGASALPGVSVPANGKSNLLNRERRAQFAEKNAGQETVTGISSNIARALGANPETPAYQIGRALGVLTPLVGKARGRMTSRGKVPDVSVQNIQTAKAAIDQTPNTTVAREVSKWTPENAAQLRKNAPELYRAVESKLASARQTPEVQAALNRLRGQKTPTSPQQNAIVKSPAPELPPARQTARPPSAADIPTQPVAAPADLQTQIAKRVTPPGDTPPEIYAAGPTVTQRAVELNRAEGIDTAIVIRAKVPVANSAQPVETALLYTGMNPQKLQENLGDFIDALEASGVKVLNRDTVLAEAGLSKASLARRAKLYGDGPVKRSPEENLLAFAEEKYGSELAPRVASKLAENYNAQGDGKPGVDKWISNLGESQQMLAEMELRVLEELMEEYARATVGNFNRPASTVGSLMDAIKSQIAKDIASGKIPNTLKAKAQFVRNLAGDGLMNSKVGRSIAEKSGLVESKTTASNQPPSDGKGSDGKPPLFGLSNAGDTTPPGNTPPPFVTGQAPQINPPAQTALPSSGDTSSASTGRPVNPSEVTVVRGTQPTEPTAAPSTAPVRVMPELTLNRSDLRVVTTEPVTQGNPLDGLVNATRGEDGKVTPQQFILRSPKPRKPGEFSERLVTITSGNKLDPSDLRQLRGTIISGNTKSYSPRDGASISQRLSQAEIVVTVQNIKSNAGNGTITTKGFPATASMRTDAYPGTSYVQFVVSGDSPMARGVGPDGKVGPARLDVPPQGTPSLKPGGIEKQTFSVPGGATQATGVLLDAMKSLGMPPSAFYNVRPGERTPDTRVTDLYQSLLPDTSTFQGMLPDLRIQNYIIQRGSDGQFPAGFRPPNPQTGERGMFQGQEILPPPTSQPIDQGGVPIRPQRQILPKIEDLFEGQGRKAPSIGQQGVTKDTYTPVTPRSQVTDGSQEAPQAGKPFSEMTPGDLPKTRRDRVDDVKLGRRYVEGVGSAVYKQRVEKPIVNRIIQPTLNSPLGQQITARAEVLAGRADALGARFAQTPPGKVVVALNNKTLGNPKFWEGLEKFDNGVKRSAQVAGAATLSTLSIAAANGNLLSGVATVGDPGLNDIEKEVARNLNFPKGAKFTYFYADVPGMEKVGGRAFVAFGAIEKGVLLPPLGQEGAFAAPWVAPNRRVKQGTYTSSAVAFGPTVGGVSSFGTENVNIASSWNASIARAGLNAGRVDFGTPPGGGAGPIDLSILAAVDWTSSGNMTKLNMGPAAVVLERKRDPVSPKVNLSTNVTKIDPTGQGVKSSIQPVIAMNPSYNPDGKDIASMGDFMKWLQSEVDKITNGGSTKPPAVDDPQDAP